jgi:hypothetical protein
VSVSSSPSPSPKLLLSLPPSVSIPASVVL